MSIFVLILINSRTSPKPFGEIKLTSGGKPRKTFCDY